MTKEKNARSIVDFLMTSLALAVTVLGLWMTAMGRVGKVALKEREERAERVIEGSRRDEMARIAASIPVSSDSESSVAMI